MDGIWASQWPFLDYDESFLGGSRFVCIWWGRWSLQGPSWVSMCQRWAFSDGRPQHNSRMQFAFVDDHAILKHNNQAVFTVLALRILWESALRLSNLLGCNLTLTAIPKQVVHLLCWKYFRLCVTWRIKLQKNPWFGTFYVIGRWR